MIYCDATRVENYTTYNKNSMAEKVMAIEIPSCQCHLWVYFETKGELFYVQQRQYGRKSDGN